MHIPFCLSKCVYCDFVSFSGRENAFSDYAEAVAREAVYYKEKCKDKIFDTVYFGGGTPSVLPSLLLQKIVFALRKNFNILPDAEWSMEVNPATVDDEKAEVLKDLGFNRISIGMQSTNDDTLRFLKRAHCKSQFEETVKLFFEKGITNLNADFILGLPYQTKEEVVFTANYLFDLGVKHISAYALKVEKGTPLSKMVRENKVNLPDDDFTCDLYDEFRKAALKNGFERYEVSNFAQKGYECRHNLNCWQYREYLGLGLNAHSFIFGKRFHNIQNLDQYISRWMSGKNSISTSRRLSKDEQKTEFVMLGLRLEKGFSVSEYDNLFNEEFYQKNKDIINRLQQQKLIIYDGEFIRIHPEKFYILNSIITEFII